MRELLKRGALKQARNRRRTSVYSSLLCNARISRKSSHASPSSLVATQHRGKSISAAVSRHATIAATFSERAALTVPACQIPAFIGETEDSAVESTRRVPVVEVKAGVAVKLQ
jgi:hypothetical protein